MSCFSKILNNSSEYTAVVSAIQKNRLPMGMLGLSHIHKAHIISSLCETLGRKAVIITDDESQATRLSEDMRAFGVNVILYPARDFEFRTAESCSREYEHLRLHTLGRILDGDYDAVICSVEAAMQFTIPPEEFKRRTLTLTVGEDISIDSLKNALILAGYTGSQQVDGAGQFSCRGGIVDFYPPDSDYPCRCEFWGDTVDSLSLFETETQRRTENIKSIKITPANEIIGGSNEQLSELLGSFCKDIRGKGSVKLRASVTEDINRLEAGIRLSSLDKYLPVIYDRPSTVFDYAESALLFVSESFSVHERGEACIKLLHEEIKGLVEEGILGGGLDKYSLTFSELVMLYEKSGAIYTDNLPRGRFDTPVRELITITARQQTPWNGAYEVLLGDLSPLVKRSDRRIAVMAGTEKTARALAEDLRNDGYRSIYYPTPPSEFLPGTVSVIPGSLSTGFEYPQEKFTLITYGSRYIQASKPKRTKKNAKNAFNNLEELHRGDYIVHNAHGIGIFDGITKLEASGTIKDYIKIKYDKGDVLYVPVTQLDQVSKYIGARTDTPVKLNRLGGKEWQKTNSRVRAAVKDMAKELIALYSKRQQIQGFAFSRDIDMQNDFERRFEFDETVDQLRCIEEIKEDMEKPYPMDRLLCGDVGFGKTEVALRGAFKCIADGKQCAILVPTTILALQHYQTIKKRFEGFPVEARMLSRFCSTKEIHQTVKDLKRGSVDIVVGTHRLISKDIEFHDLGLMIIDEEQRFGVAQKEKLKAMFPAVDVLTLTATPIPRTLNMAMSGIRDMSVLEEAPRDRYPVQTYVIEHDFGVLIHAMSTEIRRGGQVYYLHNRVETIERTAARIKEMLPDARVGIAHGKMSESELSEIWRQLLEGETDILVCTTIIETGVDVPNVNTLIIEDADKMGLAQLHQIRGRVGRSSRRASAYLTFTRGKELSEIATHRLEAIREFTEFGSGFKIAMRDLELRGAGNILGAQQHGHMESVGYDMYIKMLAQAISEEKGEISAEPEKECLIDIPIDAHIPPEYISSIPQKLSMYRRIADIRTREDADDVLDELIDRFGEPPECVSGLIKISLLRGTAIRNGVYEIGENGGKLMLYIENPSISHIRYLAHKLHGRISLTSSAKPYLSVRTFGGEDKLTLLTKVFEYLDEAKTAVSQ